MKCLFLFEVECLSDWIPTVDKGLEDCSEHVGTPVSQIALKEYMEALTDLKDRAKGVEVDVRDAKRRISSVKPKKAKQPKAGAESEDSADECW